MSKNFLQHGIPANTRFGCIGWIILMIVCLLALSSCNITRTVTTESRYVQRNDTSIVIQTKTVETYDAERSPTGSQWPIPLR